MNFFEYNYLQGLSAVEVAFVAHDAGLTSNSDVSNKAHLPTLRTEDSGERHGRPCTAAQDEKLVRSGSFASRTGICRHAKLAGYDLLQLVSVHFVDLSNLGFFCPCARSNRFLGESVRERLKTHVCCLLVW